MLAFSVDAQKNVVAMVAADFTSEKLSHMHGINIYLPESHIDGNYYRTLFAKNSVFMQFLQSLIA